MGPGDLTVAMRGLFERDAEDPRVIVGLKEEDDAAVFDAFDKDFYIVSTADFFTPIVDDPYKFGAIACANSLSDIYAMGGIPLFALNIVAYDCSLPLDILREILRGGAEKTRESGALILGGHTVDDKEPKYGLAVTGKVGKNALLRNRGAKAGDALILTKPLGNGILATAFKGGLIEEGDMDEAIGLMMELNNKAAEAALKNGATACTDVSGFGFMGHLSEMLSGSNNSVEIYLEKIPVLEGVLDFISEGIIPGGLYGNLQHYCELLQIDKKSFNEKHELLFDPETSGGLLIAFPEERCESALKDIRAFSSYANIVGRFTDSPAGKVDFC